jgi:hypothetical protein
MRTCAASPYLIECRSIVALHTVAYRRMALLHRRMALLQVRTAAQRRAFSLAQMRAQGHARAQVEAEAARATVVGATVGTGGAGGSCLPVVAGQVSVT